MIRTRKAVLAALAVAALALTGCGASGDGVGANGAGGESITVFAAASLNTTFTELGALYEREHPGATVTFNFAGSNSLLEQLANGADADVFAAADQTTMDKAVAAGVIAGGPQVFAGNVLTIVTPPDNPAGITNFADLAKPGLALVVCAPKVPCGNATGTVAANAGVTLAPVSEESSVTDVLSKVATGQADAGLVYVTDAKSAGEKVHVVDFPESSAVVNEYPIAIAADAKAPDGGRSFIELVTGVEGQAILRAAGFR